MAAIPVSAQAVVAMFRSSLSIQGGRIANVNITSATTQYPTRWISGLPGEVVSRQSPQIDIVSGATYSSLAFRGAVQQALQRAQA